MSGTLHYRVQQFFSAITARVEEKDVEEALRCLPPTARDLFHRQSRQDQRHALAVFGTLRDKGYLDKDLLAAALLHDAGKAAAHLTTWQRAIIVLMEHYSPRTLSSLSQGKGLGWRQTFVVHARHAEIGAAWAEEAGCSSLTVTLIRRHHEPTADSADTEVERLLDALQVADSSN